MIVETAFNGLEALHRFQSSDAKYFDAILMDIRMPELDGLSAAKEIRHSKHPNASTVPIIARTANAYNEDVEKSKRRA